MSDPRYQASEERILFLQKKLDKHLDDYATRSAEDRARWRELMALQQSNASAISSLDESTKDLVNAWHATGITIKSMAILGNFVKWITGFAVVGVAIQWIYEHLKL